MAGLRSESRLLQSLRGMILALFRSPPPVRAGHLYAIDFVRGIAALVVLIWHYQHFFFAYPGAERPAVSRDAQPLYAVLQPAYTSGHLAVQFFWLLSGFVFATVYTGRPANARDYAVNRFARLYPLHVLTLGVVAALQLLSLYLVGHEQIYANNDFRHFALNLSLASYWGLERGYSFNGPVWSISIEIVVYVLFWFSLPVLFRCGAAFPLLIAALGWIAHYRLVDGGANSLFLCIMYFFLGCGTYQVASVAGRRAWLSGFLGVGLLTLAAAVGWLRPGSTAWFAVPPASVGILLIFCAIEAAGHGHRFKSVRWVGDNTYGVYLWHVPIQIALLIVLDGMVGSRDPALEPWFLITFVVLVVLVARTSFVWIEAPAREWIRRRARS